MEQTNLPRVDEVVLLSEAAKILDLSQTYCGTLVKQGVLQGYQIGHIWVVEKAAVADYQARKGAAQ